MRLLSRPPETPSLKTWLGRDVPYERELANELLDQLGREKALEALLVLHDREETKRIKQRRALQQIQIPLAVAMLLTLALTSPWFQVIPRSAASALTNFLLCLSLVFGYGPVFFGYGQFFKATQHQKNIISSLFDYDYSPLIAEPLCRAIAYYNCDDRWEVFAALMCVLPLLPDDKDALTKEARGRLRNRLIVMEDKLTSNSTSENEAERARYADFEIAVLRYFARTRDRDALRTIRRLAKAKAFSDDGQRVQVAARVALQAFSEPTA